MPEDLRICVEAMEASLAEADPTPRRRWNPWETTAIQEVDTAQIGLLRVRYGDFVDPRFPWPETVWRGCWRAVWHP